MLWRGQRESDNVEDQRGVGGKTIGVGGLLIGAVVYYLMGGNPLVYLAENAGSVRQAAPTQQVSAKDDDRKHFVGVVLADTEDVWRDIFRTQGKTYRDPKLVLFRDRVDSGCGYASEASGPFYCPRDQRVYIDLGFLDELSGSLGAKGEFAGAYVIAHEVGHHVQNLLGLEAHAANKSVQIELQADCLAGVWARQTEKQKHVIEPGDIDQALGAAAAVGDDRLQKRAQGYVVPDSFTHGSSAQRVAAFRAGYNGGQLGSCLKDMASLGGGSSD